jgi:hypothetical protein
VGEVPPNVDMVYRKVRIRGVSNSKVVWEIEAERFETLKDRPLMRVTGLRRAAMLDDGQALLTLTGEGLEQNTVTSDLQFLGPVTVTGLNTLIHAGPASWQAGREVLDLPGAFSAQVGEITVATTGGAYDLRAGLIRCPNPVTLTMGLNRLSAGSGEVQVTDQTFSLYNPVHAALSTTDAVAWLAGTKKLPDLPRIPDAVRGRYQEYLRSHRPVEPRRLPGHP